MRAVLDPNVIISALISPRGSPRAALDAWREGRYELIASPALLDELRRALDYPKLRRRLPADSVRDVLALLERGARLAPDPDDPAPRTTDPKDDYLIALAEQERAVLVSGDSTVLQLSEQLPIFSPRAFIDWLDDPSGGR